MASRGEATDEIDYVRGIVRDALWNVAYHERELPKAQIKMEYAKTMLKRGSFDLDAERAETNDDGDDNFKNVTQFALGFYDEQVSSVEYHEERLAYAYREVAFAKTMLMRGNYNEIKLADIQKEIDEVSRKWEEEDKN